MSDRYTLREAAIVTILETALGSAYNIDNKESMNLGSGTIEYNILVQFTGFSNELDSGDTCYETDRENYRIIVTPLSGVLDDVANEQINIMLVGVVDTLRDYTKTNSSTLGTGETITEIRVDSAEKGYYQNRIAGQIQFSFLVDE